MRARLLAPEIKRREVGLFVILLLALALRLVALGDMSLRADEAANLVLATGSPGDIVHPFLTEDPHMPLFYLVLHYWMGLVGQSEFAARLLNALASVALVALTGALGNLVLPGARTITLLGALLAAVNPYLIWDAQDLHLYALWSVFAFGSWFAFVQAAKKGATWRAWLGYVLVTTVACYLHYLTALVLVAQGIVTLFLAWRGHIARNNVLAFFTAVAAVLVLFVPWLVVAFPMLTSFRTEFLGTSNLPEVLARTLAAFSVGRVDSRLMPAMLDVAAAVPLAAGYAGLALLGWLAPGDNRDRRWAQALCLFVPFFAIQLFAWFRFSIFDERYILFLTPVFLLFVARGIVYTVKWNKWLPAIALLFALMASAYTLNNYFRVPAFAKSPDWHGFMERLSAEAAPGDVLVQNYPDPALPYYLQNRIPRILLPHTSTESVEAVNAALEKSAAKYSRIWLQPVPGGPWDQAGVVESWLNRYAHRVSRYEFRGLQLALYVPGAAAAQSALPVNATLGGQYRLVAFEFALLPESKAAVVLYWQAIQKVERDATVFVHVYDEQGKLASQQDNAPVAGTFPTREWEDGQIVVDPYILPVPLQGKNIRLMAGMYDTQTLVRLDAVDGSGQPVTDNRVLLTQFDVGEPR